MKNELKTYVLTVAKTFPAKHSKAGTPTFFREKINEALIPVTQQPILTPKIHTIRANFDLWSKRIEQVRQGKAILSVRQWSAKPYNSKQITLHNLENVGIQKIEFTDYGIYIDRKPIALEMLKTIALNDGLNLPDFRDWFRVYPKKPMAIIHFTDFRY